MDPSFWRDRWQEGRIGFHEGRANAFLEKHVDRLGAPGRVFVPLCGKAEDMSFLASRGHEVVGIDLVESALQDFFREHSLEPEVTKGERFTTLHHGAITLHAGDVFALRPEDLAGVTAVYDRASIVALPPDMRARYAAHLRALLPKGMPILTITFDYDQSLFAGPPFSVGEAELRSLYEDATVEPLESHPASAGPLTAANAGATEKCWLVTS